MATFKIDTAKIQPGSEIERLCRLHEDIAHLWVAMNQPLMEQFYRNDIDSRRAAKIQKRLRDECLVLSAGVATRLVQLGAEIVE